MGMKNLLFDIYQANLSIYTSKYIQSWLANQQKDLLLHLGFVVTRFDQSCKYILILPRV